MQVKGRHGARVGVIEIADHFVGNFVHVARSFCIPRVTDAMKHKLTGPADLGLDAGALRTERVGQFYDWLRHAGNDGECARLEGAGFAVENLISCRVRSMFDAELSGIGVGAGSPNCGPSVGIGAELFGGGGSTTPGFGLRDWPDEWVECGDFSLAMLLPRVQ